MITVIQIICLLLAVVYSGQAFKTGLTRFDRLSYIIVSVCYIGSCIFLQGVR